MAIKRGGHSSDPLRKGENRSAYAEFLFRRQRLFLSQPYVPQSVTFFAICKEFSARHTTFLADGYRRQSRRLCDVWLRLCRDGLS